MDSYENIYKSICRVCLSQNNSHNMVSLTNNHSDDGLSCFGKAINILTSVSLQKDDKFPGFMCQKCVFLLKQAIYFKLKCESSEQKLKRLLKAEVNKSTSTVNIKQIVCEYVMFEHCFPFTHSKEPSTNNSERKKPLKSKIISNAKKTETNGNVDNTVYDFDDNIDNDDLSENIEDNQNESEHDYDKILDAMQELVNIGKDPSNFYKSNNKSKLKRILKTEGLKRRPRYRNKVLSIERNLMCKICHRVLANSLTYNHHMQRHNKCSYICDQCGKGFPVLTEMHIHQIAKHGIGPYLKCDHCPYKAPRKLNLIEHMRLHTGERPFTCDKCGLTFRRRAIWRNHLVCHMEKKHQCTYCPRKFFRRCSMLAHCNNVHERMYMYMCSVCNITYTKTETVRRHLLVKHGIPREKQGRILKIRNTNK